VQSLQAEVEELLKADAEKEEVLFSRMEEAEALQSRLQQQQSHLEDLRGGQTKSQVRALECSSGNRLNV
jgi:hypothetical protein